mmetsp:Transcript_85078/g.259930  ORF Transcript_85078/g.259930 Transcript_85078/m.259930 type:complete len:210 (-) Transcript_85078:6-635(-)
MRGSGTVDIIKLPVETTMAMNTKIDMILPNRLVLGSSKVRNMRSAKESCTLMLRSFQNEQNSNHPTLPSPSMSYRSTSMLLLILSTRNRRTIARSNSMRGSFSSLYAASRPSSRSSAPNAASASARFCAATGCPYVDAQLAVSSKAMRRTSFCLHKFLKTRWKKSKSMSCSAGTQMGPTKKPFSDSHSTLSQHRIARPWPRPAPWPTTS